MKLYRVYFEREEKWSKTIQPWSTEEILDAYNNESCYNPELLLTTENKEEAEDFFNKQKELCSSDYMRHTFGYLLEADVLILAEEEIDEDGELEGTNSIDTYAAPYSVDEDEEEEEEEEED